MSNILMQSSPVCKSCGSENIGVFCSNCGQKTHIKRFTLKSFLVFIFAAFNLEKGFFYTIKMLFQNPGKVVNDYINGKTKVYYNPLNFAFIIVGISSLLLIWSDLFDATVKNTNELMGVNQTEQAQMLNAKMQDYVKQFINIIGLLVLPFMSLISKWFYNKHRLFYSEHLILNCFLYAEVTLFTIILIPAYKLFPVLLNNTLLFGFVILVIYYTYGLRSIFKSSILKSFFGSILIYVVGFIMLMLFMIIVIMVVILILALSGYNFKELLQ